MKRLRPALDEISTIFDWRIHAVFPDVVGKNKPDPFVEIVREAWSELRKRNDPKYVRKPERPEAVAVWNMENFDRRTAIEMGIKSRRSRKPPEKPDRP